MDTFYPCSACRSTVHGCRSQCTHPVFSFRDESNTQLPVIIIASKGMYDLNIEIKRRDEYEAVKFPGARSSADRGWDGWYCSPAMALSPTVTASSYGQEEFELQSQRLVSEDKLRDSLASDKSERPDDVGRNRHEGPLPARYESVSDETFRDVGVKPNMAGGELPNGITPINIPEWLDQICIPVERIHDSEESNTSE